MGKVRYIGDEPREVPLLGRTVNPDDLIDLPDAVVQENEWPAAQWQVVDSGRKAFDPAEHTVAEVSAYLDKADDDERTRVLAAERDGQARKGVLDNAEGI